MTLPRRRLLSHLAFLLAFFAVLLVSHASLLSLPFHWDELGYFVPAALDLHMMGAWVPHSTLPNVHPPGVMAYLAAVWSLTGFSIEATRVAMLLLAAVGLWAAFAVAIELCRGASGAPALLVVAFLLCSPLFYMQAMMAQLDMPAMAFTLLALWLFLRERTRAAALVCVALVLVKETGVLAPLLLGAWLWREGRRREAAWFGLPLLALGAWVAVLWATTGHPLGNREFAEYNTLYSLHPLRLGLSLLRRLYTLCIDNFHWVGTLAAAHAARRAPVLRGRPWKIVGTFLAGHVLLTSALGGAVLERYLLPVLPLAYAAMAVGFATLPRLPQRMGVGLMTAGLLSALWWNPPYPFPFENNLAMVDFVDMHQRAAGFLDRHYPRVPVATAWPLTDALRRPEWGYTVRERPVVALEDFKASRLRAVTPGQVPLLVLYSRTWDAPPNLLQWGPVQTLLRRLYDHEPPMTAADIERHLGLTLLARWEQRGQWLEVYARP